MLLLLLLLRRLLRLPCCKRTNLTSKLWYGIKQCTTHECTGDEICFAREALVLATDGSGSHQASGRKILQNVAADLLDKYTCEYSGYEDMRIGVAPLGDSEFWKPGPTPMNCWSSRSATKWVRLCTQSRARVHDGREYGRHTS